MLNKRELLATTLSDEILNLLEDVEDDDKEFDILLTNIDELIGGYRLCPPASATSAPS